MTDNFSNISDAHSISSITRCRIIELPRNLNPNGSLTAVQNDSRFPFAVKRVFYTYDVPADSERGGHSHHTMQELIVAASGSFDVTLHDGHEKKTFHLDRPYKALYVEAGIWRTLENFSSGSVCLVLTSGEYSAADYVSDFQEFLRLTSHKTEKGEKHYPFLQLDMVNAPYIDEIKKAALRVIESGRYVGGPEVEGFEYDLAQIVDVPYAVGVSNGLDALRLILRAYKELGRLRDGDEVIVPANTYIASVLAITDNGLRPVFVDPDPVTMNLDTSKLEEALTQRTRAVMPVHLYGRACWDEKLVEFVRKHNLLVVEDNAQAIGAEAKCDGLHGNRMTGALGDAAGWSFYPTKNVGALGDAGAVTTHDKELADTVRALANYGADRRYHNIYAGLNCRLDPIQAAMLRTKLKHLDTEVEHRRMLAQIYDANISHPSVVKPYRDDNDLAVWHQYVVRVNNRDSFRKYLESMHVGTDIHYAVPPHLQPCYTQYADLRLPETLRQADSVVSLPISRCTSARDALEIADIINKWQDITTSEV